MDLAAYRQSNEAELSRAQTEGLRGVSGAAGTQTEETAATLIEVAEDTGRQVDARVHAIDAVRHQAFDEPLIIERLTRLLTADDDPTVRRAALGALREMSFRVTDFEPYQAAYWDALRALATDPDPVLRERAVEVLALQGDEYAQRLLVDGLNDPERSVVTPHKGVQFLGYDIHAEHYDLLHGLIERSDDKAVRHTALRLLAADSGAKDLYLKILRDKNEDAESRTIGAVALQSLAPEEFAPAAREIVLDDDDDDELRASCLTALSLEDRRGASPTFGEQVREVSSKAQSEALSRAAETYINTVGLDDDARNR